MDRWASGGKGTIIHPVSVQDELWGPILEIVFTLGRGGLKLFKNDYGSALALINFIDTVPSKSNFEDTQGDKKTPNSQTTGWAPITVVCLPRHPGSSLHPPTHHPHPTALGSGPHRLLQTDFPELLKLQAQGLLQGPLAVKQPSKTL